LRRERQQSPRSEADAAHVAAKTEMLQLRLMERRRAPRGDLAIRRSIERVVFEVRTEIAKVCQERADKCGEPPLDE
jgi:hypothetical protein